MKPTTVLWASSKHFLSSKGPPVAPPRYAALSARCPLHLNHGHDVGPPLQRDRLEDHQKGRGDIFASNSALTFRHSQNTGAGRCRSE